MQKTAGKLLKEFKEACGRPEHQTAIAEIRGRVEKFASQFEMPGYDNY